ncbi:FAD dependent oxidoreductase [Komagataeibacter xylinus NBRC 13693]|uniref:FAD dependent oxidoreductase n=1 Tax=Komagataeibacter xylinus NBRC 13693 TaxID=1234668 RepID=A0A0D6Q6F2_KOMXY|nr:FAD-binding oxidoreductase [Komagataeibacter xylinus]GAN98545.1 FAD dependent oxidoreductase [Komagataeibacter xylinus NBRC 13693]
MTLDTFLNDLPHVAAQTEPAIVKRKSRDFYWYSPALKARLHGLAAQAVVMPRTTDDVLDIARAARRHNVPLTVRGGGTGNYGQAVPLQQGVIVDMTEMNRVLKVEHGVARVQAGANILALDRELRGQGLEIRMFPSTKRTASIGGFYCGGSGGIGSVRWGGLSNPGNLLGARLVSLAAEPEVQDLRGREVFCLQHAYGTTGIVTEVDVPVEPVIAWQDLAIGFADFAAAAAFGRSLAMQPGIDRKLVSVIDARLVPYFPHLSDVVPPGHAIVIAMVAPAAVAVVDDLARQQNGSICYRAAMHEAEDDPTRMPLYELTWNHTTLQVLKKDRSFTYLQCLHPAQDMLESVDTMTRLLGEEVMFHLEFMNVGGQIACAGLPVFRFTTQDRLDAIIALFRAHGVSVANPHVYTLEDGSPRQQIAPELLAAKQRNDPMGLLNPGKMRSFTPVAQETPA